MSHDRRLIDTIKPNLARKSTHHLEEIVRADRQGRWSAEATEAAHELLRDRLAGRAAEPERPEEDEPPEFHYEPDELALGVLAGLLTGHLVIPYYRKVEVEDPDLPVPFGRQMAWLSLDTASTAAVAGALGLREATEATCIPAS